MLIIVDGIDGSGKDTIIDTWKEYIAQQGNAIFDLVNYWKKNKKHPDLRELNAYEFIFSAEPTYCGIGAVIRNELINKQNNYSPLAIANAYALDRMILYTQLHIPLLKKDKIIIQNRGVTTSLAYQTVHNPDFTYDYISNLEGNNLTLQNAPDYLCIVDTDPKEAISRITNRTDKKDNAIFEKLDLLQKISAKFKSEEYQNIFKSHGTKIIYLNGNAKIGIMKAESIKVLNKILVNNL